MLTPEQSDGNRRERGADRLGDSAGLDGATEWTVLSRDGAASREALMTLLRQAIGELQRPERQVIIWHYFEECPIEEMAGRLRVSLAEVTRLRRQALIHLRARLRAERRLASAIPQVDGSSDGVVNLTSEPKALLDGEQKEQER